MTYHRLAALTAASLIAGAHAAQAEGFYISANIGSTNTDHTLTRSAFTPGLPVPDVGGVGRAETTDFSGGLAFGYEYDIPSTEFYLGAEAFYTFEDGNSRNIVGVLVTDVSLENTYGARVIGGVDITDQFSLYGHLGYTEVDFNVTNSYTFAPPVTRASRSEGALSFGIGAKYDVNDRIAIFSEYTKIPDVDFAGIPEVAGGTGRINPNSLELDKISFGVRLSF